MKAPVDAARLLRESNPVADDAFAGTAGDSLGRATFERIIGGSPEPGPVTGCSLPRRRRRLLRSVAGAAALAACAVALVAVVVPGARHNGTDLTAYVVKRVDSALSAAEPAEIAQMTVTTSTVAISVHGGMTAVPTIAEEWSYGDQWRLLTYSSAGHPVFDGGFSTPSVYTVVSYQQRTWARQHGLGVPAAPTLAPVSGPHGCETVIADLSLLFRPGLPAIGVAASSLSATVASVLRTAVSCGTLAVAGQQRVDGIEAIELTSRPGSWISETIWVSPGTYLPVRVVVHSAPGKPVVQQTADITWLRPTAHNRASLTVPVPAGFRQVPLEDVRPILHVQAPKSR